MELLLEDLLFFFLIGLMQNSLMERYLVVCLLIVIFQIEWWCIQALDKIRFESLTDKSKLDAQPELFIHIIPDKTNNSLTIIDSGIGMTKAG